MTNTRHRDEVIALAAILQSCWLIDQLSKTGVVPLEESNPLVHSLFCFSPQTAEEVYGSTVHLKRGLKILDAMLEQFTLGTYSDTVRYALSVMHLQRKLQGDPAMLSTIRKRLEHISFKFQHFTDDSSEVAASVAGLYQDTISNFNFRVQVTGSVRYLSDDKVANQVRSLLFSGIRATMLWRQMGGSRWRLLFQRRALKRALDALQA
jgi:high frequency lysogenization protein